MSMLSDLFHGFRRSKSTPVNPIPVQEPELELSGWGNGVETPNLEFLNDDQLKELNSMLKWNCFTVDSQGRRFGKSHSAKKRQIPQIVPDPRIIKMDHFFDLKNKTVLEIGCFEGVHTVALAQKAKKVIAIDSRMENVVKTMVRLGFFGQSANVLCCNVEEIDNRVKEKIKADVVHHIGVLYHLKDPVTHLAILKELGPEGILLDTHYATPEMANKSYEVQNQSFRYHEHIESGGYAGVFSGMYDHAKWLHIDDLVKALNVAGYPKVDILDTRLERNGPRLTLIAR